MEPPDRVLKINPINTNTELQTRVWLQKLKRRLDTLVAGDVANVEFSECYHLAFELVKIQKGEHLRLMIYKLLKKTSLSFTKTAHCRLARHVRDITLYCETTYVLKHNLTSTEKLAEELYARTVAGHWRRLRLCALWSRRIQQWRDAFVHVQFQPGGSGALQCAREFQTMANL